LRRQEAHGGRIVQMSYSVHSFTNLIEKYPTWESFRAFLESTAGGSVRVAGGSPDNRYQILKYVKEKSDFTQEHIPWMRSVVWDTQTHRPVSVAPPKAQRGAPPTGESAPPFRFVQDFVDGTMIMMFRTQEGGLEIASRSQLGAKGTFYSNRQFGALFDDALAAQGMTREKMGSLLPSPTPHQPSSFACFVLQHPEHRIVARIHSPRLFCIHVGRVSESGEVMIQEDPDLWSDSLKTIAPASYPLTGFRTSADLDMFMKSLTASKGWFWQGLAFKDGRGYRWRIRSENYMILRELRGSEAAPVERFLRLRSQNKVIEYLRHYSEERQAFWDLEQKLRVRTSDVFRAYGDVHKAHSKKLADVEKSVQPCVFRLHALFLEQLQGKGEKIGMRHAVELVNNLPLFEQRRLLEAEAEAEAN
jgi:hypothetical protein